MYYTKYIPSIDDGQRRAKIKEFISEYTSIATVGAGYIFNSEKEEINNVWEQIQKDINFNNLLFQVARNNSLNGRTIIIPDYKDGRFIIDINKNDLLNWVNKSRITPLSAVITLEQFSIQNNAMFFILITFNLKRKKNGKSYVERKVVYQQLNGDKLPAAWVDTDVPEDLRFEPVKIFEDMDFLPVLEVYNKPFYGNAEDWIQLSDWYLAKDLIADLNRLLEIKMREAEKQQTRMYLFDQASGNNEQIAERNGLPTIFTKDMFVQLPNSQAQQLTRTWEVINGNFAANIYDDTIQKTWNMVMRLSGHSGENDSTVQQTSGEIFYNQQSTAQTAKMKQTILNDKFNKLISILFKLGGHNFNEDDWNFQITENITLDKTAQANRLLQLVEGGLKTREAAIAEIDNITLEEAKAISKEIEKKQEEEREAMLAEQMALGESADGDVGDKPEVKNDTDK